MEINDLDRKNSSRKKQKRYLLQVIFVKKSGFLQEYD